MGANKYWLQRVNKYQLEGEGGREWVTVDQ